MVGKFISGDISSGNLPKEKIGQSRVDSGPFIGIVKSNIDPTRMGRLGVLVPSLTGTLEIDSGQLVTCEYLAPFYGAKSTRYLNSKDPYGYENTQHSYGMWMVPPDIDTKVLVIFVEGRVDQAFWIGCVQDPLINHMIPGIAASKATAMPDGQQGNSKIGTYGNDELPSGEYNRLVLDERGDDTANPNALRSIHPFAETLRQEGLSQDDVRGTTTSSARRESPSQVFGISTPGRRDPAAPDKIMGVKNSQHKEKIERLTGHTLVMDDGDKDGENQLMRLRTASGHQLLLHDTTGVVYLANGSGNTWMEFSANGSIDIYAGGSVNLRSRGDMNFHSDSNINMFSQNDIKLSALRKVVVDGGSITNYSDTDILLQASMGSVLMKAPIGNLLTDVGANIISQGKGVHHVIGSQVHLNSVPRIDELVPTQFRTKSYEDTGTGTAREIVPDVNPVAKYLRGPLEVTPKGNITMTGMRMPTHEPYPFHFDKVVSFVGLAPDNNDLVPGTANYIAHRNRNSDNTAIQIGQFQADLQYYLETQGFGTDVASAVNKVKGKVTQTKTQKSITKLQELADEYTKNYKETYKIPDLPSNLSSITAGVSDAVNQTIQGITGDTVNYLKDQVFIKEAGEIFSASNLGSKISGDIKNVFGDLSSLINVDTTVGNILKNDLPGNAFGPGLGSIPKIPGIPDLQGTVGDLSLGNLTRNLSNLTSRSRTLTTAVETGLKINDLTQGEAGKALKDVLFGKNPLGDFDPGTQGIFGTGGMIGKGGIVTDVYKNIMGGKTTVVNKVQSIFSGIGTGFEKKIASIGSAINRLFS